METIAEFAHPDLTEAMLESLKMSMEGDETNHGWYNGLFFAIRDLTPVQASWSPAAGRPSIAAHTNHIRFTFNYFNRAYRGENAEVDWKESWAIQSVDQAAWDKLRADLEQEYQALREFIQNRGAWKGRGLQTHMNNVAHTAYHSGAVRLLAQLAPKE